MIDLRVIIEKYPRSISTRSQLASLLHDLYPADKREVNVVLAVYDSGIAARFTTIKTLDSIQQSRFIKQLVDEYGLQEQFASEGLEMWAKAYGVSCTITDVPKQDEKTYIVGRIEHNPDAYAKVGVVVNGSSSDFELTEAENGIVIKKFRGFDEVEIIVPNMINGKKVVGIGQKAYSNCISVQTLTVSDGIEFIDDGAFAYCKNLRHIILPDTLKRIGSNNHSEEDDDFIPVEVEGVFEESAIQTLTLPEHLSFIGYSCFRHCEALQSIDIPNGVKEIKDHTFWECTELSQVSLSETLQKICADAFNGCEALTDIRFPLSLREIGSGAFSYCRSLSVIVLNEGLQIIGEEAFSNCNSFTKFLIPSTVSKIKETYSSSHYSDLFTISTFGSNWRYMKYSKNDKVTIYCYSGSFGLEYARKKGYPIKNAADLSV